MPRCGNCSQTHPTASDVRACYVAAHRIAGDAASGEQTKLALAEPEPDLDEPAPIEFPEGYFTVVFEEHRRLSDGDSIAVHHRTFRVQRQPEDDSFMPGKAIVAFLSGPDNTANYTSFAHIGEAGELRIWKRFRDDSELAKAAQALLDRDPDSSREAYAIESGRCSRCHRVLTVPESVERGMGPVCAEAV